VFSGENIEVYRSMGKIRQVTRVYQLKDNKVARGTVGIGTRGNSKRTYFSQFHCDHYDPNVGIVSNKFTQHRDYDKCVVAHNLKDRASFISK